MKKLAILAVIGVFAIAGASQAALIQIDLGDTSNVYDGNNAPYQDEQGDTSGTSTWNGIGGGDSGVGLSDSEGNALSGVTASAPGSDGGGTGYSGDPIGNAMSEDYVKLGNGGANDDETYGTVTISGLAAGTYTVYVIASDINTGSTKDVRFAVNDTNWVTIDDSGSPEDDSWTQGPTNGNYNKRDVTLTSGQDMEIRFQHGNGLNPFSGIQIIPEPATMVLLGLGGIGVLLRRRRRS